MICTRLKNSYEIDTRLAVITIISYDAIYPKDTHAVDGVSR